MLLSVVVTLIYITGQLDLNVGETIGTVRNSAYSSMFGWHWQPVIHSINIPEECSSPSEGPVLTRI